MQSNGQIAKIQRITYRIGDYKPHEQWSHQRHNVRGTIRQRHQSSSKVRRQVQVIDHKAHQRCGINRYGNR